MSVAPLEKRGRRVSLTTEQTYVVVSAILAGLVHGDEPCIDRFSCDTPGHWHHPHCLDARTGLRHCGKHCAPIAAALDALGCP